MMFVWWWGRRGEGGGREVRGMMKVGRTCEAGSWKR